MIQNIINIFNNEEFVVHKGNKLAYEYLFNNSSRDKRIVLYGNTAEITSHLFATYTFCKFTSLAGYKKTNPKYVFIDLEQTQDLVDLFNFLNYIKHKEIFLVIETDKYPVNTEIPDLNSRLNAILNIYIDNSQDLIQFKNLIALYFQAKYIEVSSKTIDFLALRLPNTNIKSTIDFIAEESLKQNKKITTSFIKSLDLI